ncbi:MAG TPA: hypothetical protein VKH19_05270, partial [Gemmatimonadaceae bacterium]|nr:hypothetical protein [Gemmatimonadaceae bacterium]
SSLGQTLQAGSYEVAQGDRTDNQSVELTDNLMLPRGAHSVTLGGSAQLYRVRRVDLRGAFGVWTFPTLDALAQGQAQSYRVSRDFGGADVTVPGAQYALYAGDRWDVTPVVTVTYGLRADIPVLDHAPPYNPRVDALFGRRTDVVPSGHVHWSPRLGVSWDAGTGTRLTAGAGIYMGRPPLSWIVNAYGNYGMPRTLLCASASARPPSFTADANNPPLACLNGQALTADSAGPVNLVDPRLRFPQHFRAAFSFERALPGNMSLWLESQYSRAINELFFVNRNLALPDSTAIDAHGRVMYGSIAASGRSTPRLVQQSFAPDVIELTNQSKDYSYSGTAGLTKRFMTGLSANASFTYARAKDVQSHRFTRSPASDNWRLGRPVTGRQDVAAIGTSDFDQPYRVVASGTYAFTRASSTTDFSLYYVGASGFPFTYLAGGDQVTGDLNADGTPLNDPIYIPRSVEDSAEIVFDAANFSEAAQRSAFDLFIRGANCLRRQRGHIMERNSCRSPWTNTFNAAVRQSLPRVKGAVVEMQLFNVLNLLNRRWGRVPIPAGLATPSAQVNLLTQTAQTARTATSPARSVFRFDPATRRFDATNIDSYYQIQLGVRYSW